MRHIASSELADKVTLMRTQGDKYRVIVATDSL